MKFQSNLTLEVFLPTQTIACVMSNFCFFFQISHQILYPKRFPAKDDDILLRALSSMLATKRLATKNCSSTALLGFLDLYLL